MISYEKGPIESAFDSIGEPSKMLEEKNKKNPSLDSLIWQERIVPASDEKSNEFRFSR